jgi:tetratricopeptide (TPR) repeat protein
MRSITRTSARPGTSIALAVALLCGTAIGAAAFESPAHAQDEKKAKPKLSKGFQKSYAGLAELVNAEAPDEAAIRAGIPGLLQSVDTPDDRNFAGNLLLTVGSKFSDPALRLQGIDLMIESGQDNDRVGLLSYAKYQIHMEQNNYDAARASLIAAHDAGYSFEGRLADGSTSLVTSGDLRLMAAETYFEEDRYAEGLADLKSWLGSRVAAGQPIEERWIRRGFATAFNNQLGQQAADYAQMFLTHYPSTNVWADAVTVQTGFFDYDSQEVLDLMRLARRTGVLSGSRLADTSMAPDRLDLIKGSMIRFYLDYVEAADYRRLPGEVKNVLEEGIAAGVLSSGDVTIADTLSAARGRINADRADLPSLERDARRSSSVNTVMAAGDAFLSYGEAAKAEEFFAKALTMPGVDTPRIQMRLGIAQADQGKFAEAKATFDAITGKRAQIASLWSIYAQNKMAGNAGA